MAQPKETDAIKKKLDELLILQRKIDNQIERLEQLKAVMGHPSSPNIGGSIGGNPDGISKIERQIEQKDELSRKIRELLMEEAEARAEVSELIEQLDKPDEQTVIQMRYLDRQSWQSICDVIYYSRDDYDTNKDKYLKKVFKLHGNALQSLSKIYKP